MAAVIEQNFNQARSNAAAKFRDLQKEERQIQSLIRDLETELPDLQVGEALGKATPKQVEAAQQKLAAARDRLTSVQAEMDTQERILDRLEDQAHEVLQESRRAAFAEREPQRREENLRVLVALRELQGAVEAQQEGFAEDIKAGAEFIVVERIPPVVAVSLAFDHRGNVGRNRPFEPARQLTWYINLLNHLLEGNPQ